MTAKPVPEHISDERLEKVLERVKRERDQYEPSTISWDRFNEYALALTELQHRREAEAEPFCYVREWPASFDPQNGGEPASVDFSPVPKPGYEPLFKAAALGEHP